MKMIKTALTEINTDALDRQLKTALTAAVCYGITQDVNGVFVLLADDATPEQIAQAAAIAVAHNPADKTPEQTARLELEGKAAANVVNEEKLLASLPDDTLREIIVNLWARLAICEAKLGVDRGA